MSVQQRKGIVEIAGDAEKRAFIANGPGTKPVGEANVQPAEQPRRAPTVATTLRFPEDLWRAVRRAAFENGERGEKPDTAQAIVIEAIQSWLGDNPRVDASS